ncbi:WD40 repeat domain-containing serine/threonine-protein kinase [Nonomuraea sp. NPDC046570]|uniref:WD40 repeat domain-containing serine/threonine protein kinase n=1 Tax=Nonomuraea sp. NPDC046570 TaxID=3155255 RepID=UPI0033E623C7
MPLIPLAPSDPQRLGAYLLAGRLGAGGQGVVYEAYGETGERVAVKVPRLADAASRARLAREAEAARRVASFCTARVIEARTEVAEPYIVSEYVPGPTLRQVVGEAGPYEGDGLRRLAVGVATALAAIHEAGIVHRDLKPDNIILGPDGPRVIDFGVARGLEPGETTTGPLMGTPAYMAPEVLAGRRAAAAADLWAWALVVLYAARGRDQVEGQDTPALARQVLGLSPDLDGLAEPLRGLVGAALAREPEDRPEARTVLLGLLGVRDSDRLLAEGGSAAAELGTQAGEPDLGTVAEELYEELSDGERAAAPEVFLRMVGLSEDTGESVRRVARDELTDSPPVTGLLAVYGAAGLVVETGDAYALAHPGLIQAWPRLRAWLADNRDGLPVHRRLTEAARLWDGNGRKPVDLLHGSNLDRALRWAATERRDITLVRLEKEFLDTAASQFRRQSRRRGLLAGTLALLLAAALGGLGLAEYRRVVADRGRDDAAARSLALRAADLRERDPKLAMLLSAAAWRLAPAVPESLGALYDSLSQRETDRFTDPYTAAGTTYATGRDGRVVASVHAGKATLWDVVAHRRIGELSSVGAGVTQAALSPDGRTLALQDDAKVRLWDTATGTPKGAGFAAGASATHSTGLSFGPGGRTLAVPLGNESATGVAWWDLDTRERLTSGSGANFDAVNAGATLGVVYSSGGGRAELWDLKRRERVPAAWLPLKKDVKGAVFAASGEVLAVAERVPPMADPRILVRRVPSGEPLPGDGHGPAPERMAFGHGERFLALWRERRLTVLRLTDGQLVLDTETSEPVSDLVFDEPGGALRLQTQQGVFVTLDVRHLLADPALPGSPNGVARLSGDGRLLALYADSQVRLWEVGATPREVGAAPREVGAAPREVGSPVRVKEMGTSPVLAFDGDGSRLAVGGALPRVGVVVIDTATGARTGAFDVRDARAVGVNGLAFSPDGTTLAVAPAELGSEPPVELWNLGQGTATLTEVPGSATMSFRPDGKILVAGTFPELTLVDPADGTRVARPGGVASLATGPYAFDPSGRQVVLSVDPQRLSLWDSGFQGTLGAPFPARAGFDGLVWSPDGRAIASTEAGDRIRLWDVAARQPLGVLYDGMQETGNLDRASIAFSRDGRTLYSASPEGHLRAHPLDGGRVAAAVCERAGRSLTRQEWARYVQDVDYVEVC